MKKENVFKVAIIFVIVAITGGIVGFMFTERMQAPVEQKEVVQSDAKNPQTQPVTATRSDSQIPTDWKTYNGDLSGLSAQFVGKKISFSYPAEWGEAKAEKMAEGTAFDGPSEKIYDTWNISFSSGPQDKTNDYLTSSIKIVEAQKYKTEATKDVAFLERILSNKAPVGENDLKALNALGHGYGSTVFFGVNLAKKFVPKNIESNDRQIKGLTFFMQDNQAPGTDLSYNAVLFDQKTNVIIGGQFFLTSKQQDQLENELDASGNLDEKSQAAFNEAWPKKMEDLVNGSYTSNPGYMTQVKNIDLVMQSVKVQ